MKYRCLVCGYDEMPHPPRDYSICPCCGVEYGLDDAFESYEAIRREWLLSGCGWFSRFKPYIASINGNAWEQLDRAGYSYDVAPPRSSVKTDVYPLPKYEMVVFDPTDHLVVSAT